MNNHINNVREFCGKAGQPVPDSLSLPDESTRLLRAKLIVEETLEMCEAFGVTISPRSMIGEAIQSISDLDFTVNGDPDPVAIMDAAVDILWVGVTGPAVCLGLSNCLEDCVEEVDRSNLSKFIDGHRDPQSGKWIKGPSYSPANLEKIIYKDREANC
jgi:predicted HAD superfamily Cof-like phosphohydrolase